MALKCRRGGLLSGFLLVLLVAVAGCATPPQPGRENAAPVRVDEGSPAALLAFHQQLQRLSSQELARERTNLAAQPPLPAVQVRLAMAYGQPRGGGDLVRASALLEAVLKSNDPMAVSLHPLARLLADNYTERQRNDMQVEKLNQQIRDGQRRADQLQEKLNALADIERSLPARPRGARPAAPAGTPQ